MNTMYVLDAAATTEQSGGLLSMALPIIIFVAVMYFFMIRPQKKQEKETNNMRNSLTIGDEITTIGGILGRVVGVKDDVVTIETGADRVKIKIRKTAVATIDKKIDAKPDVPKGGFKVTGVKKGDKNADKKSDKDIVGSSTSPELK